MNRLAIQERPSLAIQLANNKRAAEEQEQSLAISEENDHQVAIPDDKSERTATPVSTPRPGSDNGSKKSSQSHTVSEMGMEDTALEDALAAENRLSMRRSSEVGSEEAPSIDSDSSIEQTAVLEGDPRARNAVCFSASAAVVWALFCSILLLMDSQGYSTMVVDQDRARYVVVAAQRIAVDVATGLTWALAVVDAVTYSVNRKLYVEPMEYHAARKMLEPCFAAMPALRAVDLAFANRSDTVSVKRQIHGLGVDPGMSQGPKPVTVLVQSSAEDCLDALGPLGCLRSAPMQEQKWYQAGIELYGGTENAGEGSTNTFRWLEWPSFVPRDPLEITDEIDVPGQDEGAIGWETASSLIFRVPFPGTQGYLSVIGRVTLELSFMRAAGRLIDSEGLGETGVVLLCNRAGHVLAAAGPGSQVIFQRPSGVAVPRAAWEVQAAWASYLEPAWFKSGESAELLEGGYHIAVEPLLGRGMDEFMLLVAAERDPFIDSYLTGLGSTSVVVSFLHVPAAAVVLALLCGWEAFQARQKLSRVHVAPDDAMAALRQRMAQSSSN
eukprot:TRINITY_DN32109_c0_g1_i1.p1 TRINITY_DN32109_c0_g1~~TRINITY_DN32109_c0_g1_i1.p1  ORF type:complete len:553 (+),score=104.95 TRINITY_DN32109_c0_g1_i1:188-1846(+)